MRLGCKNRSPLRVPAQGGGRMRFSPGTASASVSGRLAERADGSVGAGVGGRMNGVSPAAHRPHMCDRVVQERIRRVSRLRDFTDLFPAARTKPGRALMHSVGDGRRGTDQAVPQVDSQHVQAAVAGYYFGGHAGTHKSDRQGGKGKTSHAENVAPPGTNRKT